MNHRKTFRIEITDDHIRETRDQQTESNCVHCAIARALNENGYDVVYVENFEIEVGPDTYLCLDKLDEWQTNFMIERNAKPIVIEFDKYYDDNDKLHQYVDIC